MNVRTDFFDGARAIAPLLPAAATLSLAAGIAAPSAGLSQVQGIVMSVVVYFPTVMLAALELLKSDTPFLVVVVTSLVVGVRVVIFSLSIGPYFKRYSIGWKWLLAYFLWTPVYALAMDRLSVDPDRDVRAYYFGTAVPLWVTVQASVVVGTEFSTSVPSGLQLGFVVPLAFIALVFRFLTTRAATASALVGGVLAVLGSDVPLGLGVVGATLGGTLAGVAFDEWRRTA